jgi:CRP/FNR family transcriptional regulator, cyclic AMP receptor protein
MRDSSGTGSDDSSFAGEWPYNLTRGRGRSPAPTRVDLARKQEALARAPLFEGVSRRHLRSLARATRISSFDEGEVVVREGTPGSALYVILGGSVRVTQNRRTIARQGPGDFFGDLSLLDGAPRSATVMADTPTICLHLDGPSFRQVLAREPLLAARILATLGARLRRLGVPKVTEG